VSRAWSCRQGRGERGSASILMAGLMGVVVLLWGAAMLVAGYQLAYHRVRAAADLTAVSAAAAFANGADACEQARRSAPENGGRLLACHQVGDQFDYVVAVHVEIRVRSRIGRLPRAVRAWAYAGST
jgi:secretion/DNA translocation related TadE-like protein